MPASNADSQPKPIMAFVSWPSEFMTSLVKRSLAQLTGFEFEFHDSPDAIAEGTQDILQWSTYDVIDHELTQTSPNRRVMSSSYVIRKALIRKHFLHRTFVNYLAKQPGSLLAQAVPRTWSIDIAFADELDELWSDELWDLGDLLDQVIGQEESSSPWWILKPGMSDRGMGIRLFRTKDDLLNIFKAFDELDVEGDEADDDTLHDSGDDDGTGVATSQLRHFVIQEYLPHPLLLNPSEAQLIGSREALSGSRAGKKFHLRAYCVASGALSLYLCPNILALFASAPYSPPAHTTKQDTSTGGTFLTASKMDLSAHLTNTSLQRDNSNTEDNVRLLSELVGCTIYSSSPADEARMLTQANVDDIVRQTRQVLAETFKAALASPIHFQAFPNAFEIFGADLLVTHQPQSGTFQVHILELNAEPAIELTGARLGWILDDFFQGVATTCVAPFFAPELSGTDESEWNEGETRNGLVKCLTVEVRGSRAW